MYAAVSIEKSDLSKITLLHSICWLLKLLWMYLANRQLTHVKGIFDRHPYPSANAKGNMNLKHTYLQGKQEDTHHEVMKQSTAVNHSQESFSLTLTKLLVIDGLKESRMEKPCLEHWGMGQIQ